MNYFKDQISPIANKMEDEFDYEIEKIFNNKDKDKLFDGNSLLNMNITNGTNTYLNGSIAGKIAEKFKNKNFFDNSVLNKINSVGEINTNNQGNSSNVGSSTKIA